MQSLVPQHRILNTTPTIDNEVGIRHVKSNDIHCCASVCPSVFILHIEDCQLTKPSPNLPHPPDLVLVRIRYSSVNNGHCVASKVGESPEHIVIRYG